MDADSAMGDNMIEHYLDGEERSMLTFGAWHDGSSGGSSSRVSGGYHDSSSPDAWYSSPVASAVAARSKSAVVAGSLRGRRFNDKLYAIRSVVPNITKMDKAFIIRDAIQYIQHLQEQERQLLAEISILESAAPATQLLRTVEHGVPAVVLPDSSAHHSMPPMKKMRRFMSSSTAATAATPASAMATTSRRIEALELSVTGVGDKVLLVSVACRHRKEALPKVCRALEGLRLDIISSSTNVTSTSGTLKHTALVQRGEIGQSEMKEVIETAIAHVDAVGVRVASCY